MSNQYLWARAIAAVGIFAITTAAVALGRAIVGQAQRIETLEHKLTHARASLGD